MLAGLPYVVWPVGSLFVLLSRKRDDPFLHYHAVQGLLWGGVVLALTLFGTVGLAIIFRLLPGSSTYLPGMLGIGMLLAGCALAMLVFFTAVFLGWRATEGEMLRLPFIGDYAEGKMLDHTGMTRRDFLKMLEASFVEPNPGEPEPIPFPPPAAASTPALSGRAAEIMAQRATQDATPASLKAAEILGLRSAKSASAVTRQIAVPASLQVSVQPEEPAPRAVTPPPMPKAAPTSDGPQVKNYPLIREVTPAAAGKSAKVQPSPSQRSPRPPQRAQSSPGWQQSPPDRSPAAKPTGPANPGSPQVKDVDLVRHYKERRDSVEQQSDTLRKWLSSVDQEPSP